MEAKSRFFADIDKKIIDNLNKEYKLKAMQKI